MEDNCKINQSLQPAKALLFCKILFLRKWERTVKVMLYIRQKSLVPMNPWLYNIQLILILMLLYNHTLFLHDIPWCHCRMKKRVNSWTSRWSHMSFVASAITDLKLSRPWWEIQEVCVKCEVSELEVSLEELCISDALTMFIRPLVPNPQYFTDVSLIKHNSSP